MGQNLQDRIKNLDEFRPDINFKDGIIVLKIKYKNGWTVLNPEDGERVAFDSDKTVQNLYWYVARIEDADLIFDIIESTISLNKELEKKLTLYREKVKELQELFLSSETYERLLTLQFVFPDEKKKYNRSQKKTKVQKNDEIETISDSNDSQDKTDEVKSADGISVACETITEEYSNIDDKILRAIGE